MNHRRLATVVTFASLLCSSAIAMAQDAQAAINYVCPPCGSACHSDEYDAPGACSMCGMTLIDATTVPRVAILVFDGVDLSSFAVPAGVFSHSNRVLVHTVADTMDEVNSSEVITFMPGFSFDDAPNADVLILVGGSNIMDYAGDTMVEDWVAQAAEAADHVLCVGLGMLFLQSSGALKGLSIPVPPFLARNIDRFLPGSIAEVENTAVTHGKIHLALNEAAAIQQALAILAALTDNEVATSTAKTMGFTYLALPTKERSE